MKRTLKNLRLVVFGLLLGATAFTIVETACTVPAQRKAVNTIASVETTATAAVDAYFTLVVQGKASTNGVPAVTRSYNALQQAIKVALTEVQANSNALAPGTLITASTDLLNLINQAKGK